VSDNVVAATQTPQANAGKDICAAKKWFGSKTAPPCKVCAACKDEEKDQCTLYPAYKPNCCGKQNPPKTPHHLVPVHCMMPSGERAAANRANREPAKYEGCEKYNEDLAPCICVSGHGKDDGDHEILHDDFDPREDSFKKDGKAGIWTYAQARDAAAESTKKLGCDDKCIKAQLDEYHTDQCGMDDGTKLRADSRGRSGKPAGLAVSNTASGADDT
jgi:hypothetical protein